MTCIGAVATRNEAKVKDKDKDKGKAFHPPCTVMTTMVAVAVEGMAAVAVVFYATR